jgi:hypothetical protein
MYNAVVEYSLVTGSVSRVIDHPENVILVPEVGLGAALVLTAMVTASGASG